MQCREIKKIISLYLDDCLSWEETKAVKQHLKNCTRCRQEFSSFEKVIRTIKLLNEISIPEDFQRKLHQKLNAIKRKRLKMKQYILFLPAGAVAALFIFLTIHFMPGFFGEDMGVALNGNNQREYGFNLERRNIERNGASIKQGVREQEDDVRITVAPQTNEEYGVLGGTDQKITSYPSKELENRKILVLKVKNPQESLVALRKAVEYYPVEFLNVERQSSKKIKVLLRIPVAERMAIVKRIVFLEGAEVDMLPDSLLDGTSKTGILFLKVELRGN